MGVTHLATNSDSPPQDCQQSQNALSMPHLFYINKSTTYSSRLKFIPQSVSFFDIQRGAPQRILAIWSIKLGVVNPRYSGQNSLPHGRWCCCYCCSIGLQSLFFISGFWCVVNRTQF